MKQKLKIERIRIFRIRIPFSVQVTHNLAKRVKSQGFLVEIADHEGKKGFGEGTPRAYVTGEGIDATASALSLIAKEALGREFDNEGNFLHFLENLCESSISSTNPSSLCAFELALMDLFTKKLSIPLWKLFRERPAVDELFYSSILPVLSEEQRKAILRLTHGYSIKQIKTKALGMEQTIEVTREIRETIGSDADIRIDANGAFSAAQAITLVERLEEAGLHISCFEQPVDKDDLAGLREVDKKTGIPVMADESFCTERDLQKILDSQSCSGLNVRLSKCGGLLKSKGLVDSAKKAGLFCQLGCHVGETSILSAAGRHLAAICGPFRFVEGCYSRFLLKEDIVETPLEFGPLGRTLIPTGPGLGIEINKSAVRRWCTNLLEIEK